MARQQKRDLAYVSTDIPLLQDLVYFTSPLAIIISRPVGARKRRVQASAASGGDLVWEFLRTWLARGVALAKELR